MSTKMSCDLNITRPTSRVIRAPGGGSSFSIAEGSTDVAPTANRGARHLTGGSTFTLSDGSSPTVAAVATSVAPAPVSVVPVAAVGPKPPIEGKVAVLIAGELAAEALTSAISKALYMEGIRGSQVATVNDVAIVAFAAQKMLSQCDVLIVASIVLDPTNTVVPALRSALSQISLAANLPIIPAFVVQDSLLEAKAILSSVAPSWAKSAATVLDIKTKDAIELVTAADPIIVEPVVYTPSIDDAGTLMAVLRESLKAHGARGMAGLSRKFRIADDNNSGTVDIKEFTKVVGEHALGWTAAQIKLVFDQFDSDKSGAISFDEFMFGVRGQLNERRQQLVLMAFEILDADHSGIVELNDISAKYNADKHPDVISGKRSKQDVLREFLDTFDTIDKDGKVTAAEFIKYYGNCSASIDDDDYFELMIRNAWHISGGEGWCANSSCRRVLVGHKDGTQTVEEIKNDLGITADDKALMIERLTAQGVKDIEYIEGSDGVKFTVTDATAAALAATSLATTTTASIAPVKATAPANADLWGTRPSTAPAAPMPGNNRRHPGGGQSTIHFG